MSIYACKEMQTHARTHTHAHIDKDMAQLLPHDRVEHLVSKASKNLAAGKQESMVGGWLGAKTMIPRCLRHEDLERTKLLEKLRSGKATWR